MELILVAGGILMGLSAIGTDSDSSAIYTQAR